MIPKEVLAKAMSTIPNCDIIVDAYTLTILWVSDKVVKLFDYPRHFLINKKPTDIYDQRYGEEKAHKRVLDRFARGKGEDEIIIKKRENGSILVVIEFQVFELNQERMFAAKIVSSKEASPEDVKRIIG